MRLEVEIQKAGESYKTTHILVRDGTIDRPGTANEYGYKATCRVFDIGDVLQIDLFLVTGEGISKTVLKVIGSDSITYDGKPVWEAGP